VSILDDIGMILKAVAPEILKNLTKRAKDGVLREFVKKLDVEEVETYDFGDGTEENVTWKHFILTEDSVIGIGKRGPQVKKARRVRRGPADAKK